MDDRTVSGIIEDALNKALSGLEDYEEGDFVSDWILIAHTSNPDTEKGGAYPMFFSNGFMPDYRATGLLRTGLTYLEYGLVSSQKKDEE